MNVLKIGTSCFQQNWWYSRDAESLVPLLQWIMKVFDMCKIIFNTKNILMSFNPEILNEVHVFFDHHLGLLCV